MPMRVPGSYNIKEDSMSRCPGRNSLGGEINKKQDRALTKVAVSMWWYSATSAVAVEAAAVAQRFFGRAL